MTGKKFVLQELRESAMYLHKNEWHRSDFFSLRKHGDTGLYELIMTLLVYKTPHYSSYSLICVWTPSMLAFHFEQSFWWKESDIFLQ